MSEQKNYITRRDETGSINISEDVLTVVAGGAALEVEGVYSLHPSHGHDIGELLNKKVLGRSIRTKIEDSAVTLDLNIIAELGSPVNKVGEAVQSAVVEAVESTIGVKPEAVNVHICGVSLKKKRT